jgi:hypothetical protein
MPAQYSHMWLLCKLALITTPLLALEKTIQKAFKEFSDYGENCRI